MGSGTNRKWWADKGTRTNRKKMSKTNREAGNKIKSWRASAKKRASMR